VLPGVLTSAESVIRERLRLTAARYPILEKVLRESISFIIPDKEHSHNVKNAIAVCTLS
jgi:hypothetical protein